MRKAAWKKKIKQSCEEAGTYQPCFEATIDILAGIMELRDNAQERFEALGGNTVVKHTNKGGATNIVKNPALVVIMECNTQALAYWRELGLTPRGFQAVQEITKTFRPAKESKIHSMVGHSKWKRA